MKLNGLFVWSLSVVTVAVLCMGHESEEWEVEDGDVTLFDVGHEHQKYGVARKRRYLLYDVNMSEGFNLRRDVYLRVANLVRKLRKYEDWILVLPPWSHLYHWKSRDIGKQIQIPWSHFFDVPSLNKHVQVIEFHEFAKEIGTTIDFVYELQHYEDTFKDVGFEWTEKAEESECLNMSGYEWNEDKNRVRGRFWNYADVNANNFSCLSLQGQASTLKPLLLTKSATSIMLDKAEIMLHDGYGDSQYWRARRSMRFSKHLRQVGDDFRLKYLNSTDLTDNTQLEEDWRDTKVTPYRALGGPYLAVHLRREDFLTGRTKHVPSLENVAKQIKSILKSLDLKKVFVATDAPSHEFQSLKSHLDEEVVRFVPTKEDRLQLKDGGIAIIDQWICSHARYFIGTHESTFSFRIQEEREILGFNADTSFNRLCGDKEEKKCQQPTRWLIVYD